MKILFLFPNQLFALEAKFLKSFDCVFLIEHSLFFGDEKYFFKFHKQKLVLHRASMREYFDNLPIDSKKYIEHTKECFLSSFKDTGIKEITVFDVVDFDLEKRLKKMTKRLGLELVVLETPMFIESKESLDEFFKDKKSYNQTSFYRAMRKKHNILIEADGSFVGGKLTFDTSNRKKLPKGHVPVNSMSFENSDYVREAKEYVEKNFADNYGELMQFNYPTNHLQAHQLLEYFLEYKFDLFGPYEDAISREYSFVYHSMLSSCLNIGLLTPMQVIRRALDVFFERGVAIESVEGFIRQIMGWREFMRAMYVIEGVNIRNKNFFNSKNKLPKEFWTAKTGLLPVDVSIKRSLDFAYCHHIERLMVLGNVMCLLEIDPDDIYLWFMEMFIDAYDWVMVPNVYSMSQYADGGLLTTKPYISGSNYLLKMSDYSKSDWCGVWDALYWRFINKHRDFFASNPRLNMMVSLYDKKTEVAKQEYANNLKENKIIKNLNL